MRRPNGTGSVIKLPGKRRKPYTARICVGKTISKTGKVTPKYKYLDYFPTAKDAQEYLDRYNGTDEAIQKLMQTSKKQVPTFAQVYQELTDYLNSRPKPPGVSSCKALNAAFNNLSGLHPIKMKNIDYDLLQAEITKNSHLSQSSLNNIKNLLHKMYTLCLKKKYVNEDLSLLCDYDYKQNTIEKHIPFTKHEINIIYNDNPSADRDMLLILLYTGIRAQEFLELKTQNVHLDEHYFITGVKTEAGKGRIIPIHNDILPIMRAHYISSNYYFWNLQGSQRIYQTLRWRFDRYLKTLNIQHLPHDTRHTTATLMDSYNVRDVYIKLIMGHAIDDLTLRVYIHQKPSELVNAINKVHFLPRHLKLQPKKKRLIKCPSS